MAKQFVIFAIVALFAVALAQDDGVDHSLHCHRDDDDSIHLNKGETATLKGNCILVKCLDPDTDKIEETKCPQILPKEKCHVTKGDLSKPFPGCCPKAEC